MFLLFGFFGALTSKFYAFKGRSWENDFFFSYDVTDVFLRKVRYELNVKGFICRILSYNSTDYFNFYLLKDKDFEILSWLDDRSRYFFEIFRKFRIFLPSICIKNFYFFNCSWIQLFEFLVFIIVFISSQVLKNLNLIVIKKNSSVFLEELFKKDYQSNIIISLQFDYFCDFFLVLSLKQFLSELGLVNYDFNFFFNVKSQTSVDFIYNFVDKSFFYSNLSLNKLLCLKDYIFLYYSFELRYAVPSFELILKEFLLKFDTNKIRDYGSRNRTIISRVKYEGSIGIFITEQLNKIFFIYLDWNYLKYTTILNRFYFKKCINKSVKDVSSFEIYRLTDNNILSFINSNILLNNIFELTNDKIVNYYDFSYNISLSEIIKHFFNIFGFIAIKYHNINSELLRKYLFFNFKLKFFICSLGLVEFFDIHFLKNLKIFKIWEKTIILINQKSRIISYDDFLRNTVLIPSFTVFEKDYSLFLSGFGEIVQFFCIENFKSNFLNSLYKKTKNWNIFELVFKFNKVMKIKFNNKSNFITLKNIVNILFFQYKNFKHKMKLNFFVSYNNSMRYYDINNNKNNGSKSKDLNYIFNSLSFFFKEQMKFKKISSFIFNAWQFSFIEHFFCKYGSTLFFSLLDFGLLSTQNYKF